MSFLADKCLVTLRGESGSYINASFMNVSKINNYNELLVLYYRAIVRRKHLL